MKKIFLFLTLILLCCSALCRAAEPPTVTSDKRSFNPLTGVYLLEGHATVRWPDDRMDLVIACDRAQVLLYQLEVHAEGNIKLDYDKELRFTCDKVDVYHTDRTAYCSGNTVFRCGKDVICADKGAYCWKTKLAVFSGNVKVNGKPWPHEAEYNVKTHKLSER